MFFLRKRDRNRVHWCVQTINSLVFVNEQDLDSRVQNKTRSMMSLFKRLQASLFKRASSSRDSLDRHRSVKSPVGTKTTKSRRGKEVAGASVPVVGDGTNPTQVLPTQTGLVNNETGEPLGPILPTEVQVDNLGEQQELGCEEEGESSHAGDQAGRGTGTVELAEPSMREVLDVVKAMGTQMLAFTRANSGHTSSTAPW
ncbi:hypothetical protein F2Q69_00031222 [Brassica cretica]|uniref:Uncharacterized protein n=1 Tax=Brassica cretica TaxID=69181 RepID=A0A8S9RTZ3_BRACR|nr:hypothetical protein F2Q69_00031222 [Brassica cretica]